MLDEKVGLEMAREWRNSAEDVLIAFAEGPLPHGRPNADTMHWWSRMRPRTPLEEAMANVSILAFVSVVFVSYYAQEFEPDYACENNLTLILVR